VRRAPIAVAAAVALAGCGNDRTAPPDFGRIPAPKAFHSATFARDGMSLRVPTDWRMIPGTAPQIAMFAIGDAQIAVWRYPRTEPLPQTRDQLQAARVALLAQVRNRDATFRLMSSRLVIKDGLRGVELIAAVTNQGRRRSVRSLHAYGKGAEVVVDAFAPPTVFRRVDRQTFGPVTRSLKLRAPRS
jgi:hypothetical protein